MSSFGSSDVTDITWGTEAVLLLVRSTRDTLRMSKNNMALVIFSHSPCRPSHIALLFLFWESHPTSPHTWRAKRMREKNAYFTLRQESELGARCGASDDPARVKTTGNRGATRGRTNKDSGVQA